MVFDAEKVKKYADKQLRKGFSPKATKKVLLKTGVPEKMIDRALKESKQKRKETKKKKAVSKEWLSRWKINLVVLIAAALVLGLVLSIFIPKTCRTADCFIAKANSCSSATYKSEIEGITFGFETKDCLLTKTIVDMQADEPEEVKELFLGKSMVCAYVEGDFSPLYLTTISGMINTCEGELRNVILMYVV